MISMQWPISCIIIVRLVAVSDVMPLQYNAHILKGNLHMNNTVTTLTTKPINLP